MWVRRTLSNLLQQTIKEGMAQATPVATILIPQNPSLTLNLTYFHSSSFPKQVSQLQYIVDVTPIDLYPIR